MTQPASVAFPYSYPTPLFRDVIIAERRSASLPENERPQEGSPHPDPDRYPHHRLVKIIQIPNQIEWQLWIYAAPWEDQDLYNFEFVANGVDARFDAVTRGYMIPRADFRELDPARGAAMPDPTNQFRDEYILYSRKEVRAPIDELASHYVFEERTYVRRTTITKSQIDIQTSRSKFSVTTIYHRGETLNGVEIGELVADRNNAYWNLQPNGIFREIDQFASDWFAVTESTVVADGTTTPGGGDTTVLAPPTNEIIDRPTPKVSDYIVHFKAVMPNPPPAYGDNHPSRTGFKLRYIKPADESGVLYEFFYVKDFANQDDYNMVLTSSDIMLRTYIIPRGDYLAGTALATLEVGDTVPNTATGLLSLYGYTHEYFERTDVPLDSFFVAVTRVFQKIEQSRTYFDDELDRHVRESVTFISKGSNEIESRAGLEVLVDESHGQYDVRTTKELLPNEGDTVVGGELQFPIQLPTLPDRGDYPIPALLTGVTIEQAWAIAVSTGAPPDFDQDYYFNFKTIRPKSGPYEGRRLRFLTDNPEALVDAYPSVRISPSDETIGVASAWFYAHPEQNRAKATARQINVPETIHGPISISEPDGPAVGLSTTYLPATPGFANFSALSIVNADVVPSKTRFNLYIVEVKQLNIGGVFNNAYYPFGTGTTGAYEVSTDTTDTPVVVSASVSADNQIISGVATPEASIRIYSGSGSTLQELGQGPTDVDGNFTISINTVYTDAVTVNITARKNGRTSTALQISTHDLAPNPPVAWLDNAGVTLEGRSEPGAIITISPDPVQQEITLTPSGTASGNGTILVEFTTVFIPSSPVIVTVPVTTGMTDSQLAVAIRQRILATASGITALFDVDVAGSDLKLTKKVPAVNDATMEISTAGGYGFSAVSSTITTEGYGPVTVTASGTGVFEYNFSPALPPSTSVSLTATDGGGTSSATVIVASASNPEILTAAFSDPGTITGTATALAKIKAIYDGDEVGDATVDGDGDFELTLSRLFVGGEKLYIYAHDPSDPGIRSLAFALTATNLNLLKPVISKAAYSSTRNIYYGTLLSSILAISGVDLEDVTVIVKERQGGFAEKEVEINANLEWSFILEDLLELDYTPEVGERFDVFYRIALAAGDADSPAETIAFPAAPIPASSLAWTTPKKAGLLPSFSNNQDWSPANQQWEGSSWVSPFNDFITRASNGTGTPQIGVTEQIVVGSPAFPGSYRAQWQRPDASKNLVWIKVPYMGSGTVVTVRYPGSSLEAFTATLTAGTFKEMQNIPVIQWPHAGNGGSSDPDMTIEKLREVIPPVIVISVTAPDGRSSSITFERKNYAPF